MTSRDFCYWLMGSMELKASTNPSESPSFSSEEYKCIKAHLNLVFKHEIDPSMGPKEHQTVLNQIHNDPNPLIRC